MELTCRQCGARFRAAIQLPLTTAVRVACPSCQAQVVLKPAPASSPAPPTRPSTQTASGGRSALAAMPAPQRMDAPVAAPLKAVPTPAARRRTAVVAEEPRPFRVFLGEHLRRLGFEVTFFENGEETLDFVRRTRPDLAIVNVYLKGKLGVEVAEDIKADSQLGETRVILIGALFRANRFRANPTNLYGADEYIEEQIPQKEFESIIRKLFPQVGQADEAEAEPREYDEARRLARLILSDIVIYHAARVDRGIRENNFFEVLREEIDEGRRYYESRVSPLVRRDTEIFTETLQQFVQMKREELERLRT